MKTGNAQALEALLAPRSVAVVGASHESASVGGAVFANLIASGYAGPLWPVNPSHSEIAGRPAWPTIAALPGVPDLAIVCTPARVVPQVIADLGAVGTRAAVVLTAGLDEKSADGRSPGELMCESARHHGLRIVGPNCVGLRVPRLGLNASFAGAAAIDGPLALVAQSGGVIAAFLDWATPRGIGVSCCVSLGNAADVSAADLVDLLAADAGTKAILLYLESARDGRRLIEAAQRAVRVKPVFALKVGRVREGAAAAATHTGALAGADNVWEAALLAAGVRRLDTLQDLYGVAELIARLPAAPQDRITVVTNSGGPAVLAVDALITSGGSLATLSTESVQALDRSLPASWSRRNPVDLIGDASPQRYIDALAQLERDPAVQTTLVMHVPTDLAPAVEVRRLCNDYAAHSQKPLIGCWVGGESRDIANGVMPAFTTPEDAVRAIVHVAWAVRPQNGGVLSDAGVASAVSMPDLSSLAAALRAERAAGRAMASVALTEQVLQAAGIAMAPVRLVPGESALEEVAATLGYPVVLKIQSPDIPHKSDVGGVVTGIGDAAALRTAASAMLSRCAALRPTAVLQGFQLQRQVETSHARELIVGITRDAEFGPVVLFGHGGTAVHVVDDTAIGIPPLDDTTAGALVQRTRVSRLLAAWRDWPAADLAAVREVLVRISQLALCLPEIRELDINPLLAHPGGAIALDARIAL